MNFVEDLFNFTQVKTYKAAKVAKKKFLLLKTIYEMEKATVNDLMAKMDLSFPTINSLMIDLLEQKYIVQAERGVSFGGRKPNLYQLNGGLFKILTIELNKVSAILTVMDNNCNALSESRAYEFSLTTNLDGLSNLIDLVHKHFETDPIPFEQISGIAISMPGLIDWYTGENYTYFYETGFQLESFIEKVLKKPARIVNDAKVASISERYYGHLKGAKDSLIIRLDWGISLGILARGEMALGKSGFAGEMGHISLGAEGELCYCGKRGCLETIASGLALVNRAKADIADGMPTMIVSKFKNNELRPEHIVNAALDGDQYAIQLISELGSRVGRAISIFIQIFNPETIVLTGCFAEAASLMTTPIQQQIQTFSMQKIAHNCTIEISKLGPQGQLFGLVRCFIDRYFEDRLEMN
ncbi:ROK family protein [Sphingobacterium lactis]|uniref:ROK family protein n=1 Tax=Sphingobacterium lactis TaxID=797291 RepID=UPI003DA6BCD8